MKGDLKFGIYDFSDFADELDEEQLITVNGGRSYGQCGSGSPSTTSTPNQQPSPSIPTNYTNTSVSIVSSGYCNGGVGADSVSTPYGKPNNKKNSSETPSDNPQPSFTDSNPKKNWKKEWNPYFGNPDYELTEKDGVTLREAESVWGKMITKEESDYYFDLIKAIVTDSETGGYVLVTSSGYGNGTYTEYSFVDSEKKLHNTFIDANNDGIIDYVTD